MYWLRDRYAQGPIRSEWAVDAVTYRLVRQHQYPGTRHVVDIPVYETIQRDDADFVASVPPTAAYPIGLTGHGDAVGPADAVDALPGAQWVGPRIAGLPLRELSLYRWHRTVDYDPAAATYEPGGPKREVEARLLIVAYGEKLGTLFDPAPKQPTGLEIVQAAVDNVARFGLKSPVGLAPELPPPPGTFDSVFEDEGGHQFYTAELQKPGVWIRVRATSWKVLLEAVRSLRVIPPS